MLGFAIAPDSTTIASRDSDGRVAVRAIRTGWAIERYLDDHGRAKGLAISPSGRYLAVGGCEPDVSLPTL